MIPDADAMEALARALEEVGHESGWDNQPAVLAVVIGLRADDGDQAYGLLPFPLQPHQVSPEPAQGLLKITAMLQPGEPMAKFVLPKGTPMDSFAGWGFMCEAWFSDVPPEDRDQRRLADIPGSQECRIAHVVDCAGRYTAVQRLRGGEPTVDVVQPGAQEWEVQGNIPVALRDLVLAVGMRMPFGSVDLDAVRSLVTNPADHE